MKRLVLSVMMMAALIGALAGNTQTQVFVIPIEREIDMGAFRQFRSAVKEAVERNSDLVVLRLNTYGGAVDAADSIRTGLLRLTIPTVAFINNNAASAGALIALACDSVFMAPGSLMGSATVVDGVGTPLPQKYQSYMQTMMRATAEHHGRYVVGPDSGLWRRNPEVAAMMVQPDTSLSLTSTTAIEVGFADGIAEDIPQVLEQLNSNNPVITTYEPGFTEDLLGFLSSAAIRAVLVMLILGGIYMEMHTPGLGFAAAVAVVAAVLYFMPMFASDSLPAWVLIMFIAGIVLINLEIFVIPGFGICGVCGIIAIFVSLVGAATANDNVSGFSLSSIGDALISIGVGTTMAIALVLYLTSSRAPKIFQRHTQLQASLNSEEGYIGVDMSPAKFVGQMARAITDMRPSGKIDIDGEIFDAVSAGNFIPAGAELKVIKYENAQLYVNTLGETTNHQSSL